jgi:uncharacterized membrane protein
MDALSEAILRLLRRYEQIDRRLARVEAALNLQPIVPQAPPLPQVPVTSESCVTAPPSEPEPPPVAPLSGSLPAPLPAAPALPTPPALETNIGLTLVNRIGVVTLVLGIAFFFKWAVDNQWIGPAGRVIFGVIAGLVSLAVADVLWRKGQRIVAQGVTAIGLGFLYLAVYAAFGYYQLIPQSFAFAFMVATTALAVALALRYASVAMAMLGLMGGYLTPILLSTGEDRPWFLLSYLLLLNVAALLLARAREWRSLEILSFVATAIIYGAWFLQQFKPEKQFVATFFTLIYYALFSEVQVQPIFLLAQILATAAISQTWPDSPGVYLFLTLTVAFGGLVVADMRRVRVALGVSFGAFWTFYGLWFSSLHSPWPVGALFSGTTCAFLLFFAWAPWRLIYRQQPARAQDLTILALNGAAYFGASYALLNASYHAWMGLFAVAIAGLHVALAGWLRRERAARQADQQPALLSLGVALTLLTLAAPIQFTAYRITMAWSLEFLALSWIALRTRHRLLGFGAVVVSALVWVRLLTIDSWIYSDPASYTPIWNARFLTFLIAAVCSWLAAYWSKPNPGALIEYIAGHVIMLWVLSLEDLGWAVRTSTPQNLLSVETVSISILFAIYAVLLISIGVATRTAINRIAGLGLMGFVVVKLYLFDVWQLGRVYRISAFVALGVLLLGTSFLYSHFRALIESWWKNDQAPS